MANQIRTLDFLPEVFQTETNKQFLGSTLDVITSQPELTRVQGYIGNKYGHGVNPTDKYIESPTDVRSNYQLDPAVVFLKEDTQTATDFIDYPGIITALGNQGASTNNHNRLFSSEMYSWDSFADPDKLVNFSQYYWLPLGPDKILIRDTIDVSEIEGATTYTTPSGITLVNGIKIMFVGPTTPTTAANISYYVEGVGSSIALVPEIEMLCTELTGGGIYTPWDKDNFDIVEWSIALYVPTQPDYVVMNRASRDRNAWSRGNRWFHQSAIDLTLAQNGVITNNQFNTMTRAQRPIVEFQPNLALHDSGSIGASKIDFFDTVTTDPLSSVAGQSKFTLRSNVTRTSLRTTANYIVLNNTDNLTVDMEVRLFGDPGSTGLTLYNAASPSTTRYYINSIDAATSSVSLKLAPTQTSPAIAITLSDCDLTFVAVSVVQLQNNTTVVFANADDIVVRKTVYKVTTVAAGTKGAPVIALTALPGVTVSEGSQVHIAAGPGDYTGTSWRFISTSDGTIRPPGESSWTQSQPKTAINQPPYFDIFDSNGTSFGDSSFYPSTTFTGSRLFGYAIGTGTNDSVLGFPVVYSSPTNTGDFLFSVYLNSDTFTYKSSTGSVLTKKVSDGFVHYAPTATTTVNRLGWVKSASPSTQYQVFVADITAETQQARAVTTLAGKAGSNTLLVDNVNTVEVGYSVTGAGLIDGTLVTKITGNTVTLNKALLTDATGGYVFAKTFTTSKIAGIAEFNTVAQAVDIGAGKAGSKFLQLNNTTGIAAGDTVAGYGVVYGTKVVTIIGEVVTLSAPLVDDCMATSTYNSYTFTRNTTTVTKTYTGNPAYKLVETQVGLTTELTISEANLTVVRGQTITGYGIPTGTVILTVTPITTTGRNARGQTFTTTRGYTVVMSNALTANTKGEYTLSNKFVESNSVDSAPTASTTIVVSSADGIKAKQIVTGKGISGVVQIDSIDGNELTLTSALTESGGGEYSFRSPDVTCDIVATNSAATLWAPVQVYKNGAYSNNTEYTVTTDLATLTTAITFNTQPAVGDQITVMVISGQVSDTAFYQIPSNLQSNPFNKQITTVAAGDLKNYYASIFSNTPGATGDVFGNNNLGNLGDVTKYGASIVQNSGSLVLPGVFLRKAEYNLQNALQYNNDEYDDYKAGIIDLAVSGDYSVYQQTSEILDDIIYQISSTKSQSGSFYWTDMLVAGSPYKVNTYTFKATLDTSIFALTRTYDYTSANYYGIAIYLKQIINNREITTQLIRGIDYTVSATEPSVTITKRIAEGSTIAVKEYNQTYGSYVPNTPTKLGLYPSTVPHVVTDRTYRQPTTFIVGHDGSYTKLYGEWDGQTFSDFRDAVLFEFELRVYNNLKTSGRIPLDYTDLFPGQWRYPDYSWEELLPAYTTNFLNWVGKNRLTEYRRQVYNPNDKFTYNYNRSTNRLSDGLMKQGNWRGIYHWFYDTSNPADAPWEMLGLTFKPGWWDSHYGAAPYTSGNTLMWQDIADGRVWNNGQPYIVANRVRPGLLDALPVDEMGRLVDPLIKTVGSFNQNTFERNWVAGDHGPTEAAYRRSSSWPFDLMKMLAAFKPVAFYNLNVDRDFYKYDDTNQQYLFNGRYHLDPTAVTVYGNGVAKHSYINWVVDFIKQYGTDGQAAVATTLKNIDVRLVHRLAGFSDKDYLQFLAENSAPSSSKNSLLIPDESYSVLLYDNIPSDKIVYSSVIVQKTNNGYTVWGNSVTAPYFKTVAPIAGPQEKVVAGTETVSLSSKYDPSSSVSIAYGTEFYSMTGVCEFLRNYGRYLLLRGVTFENLKNDAHMDWDTMGVEFLLWAQQNWEVGSTISLNPNATSFTVYRQGLIVQPLTLHKQNFVLNQNLIPLVNQNMAVIRDNEHFKLKTLSEGDTVALTHLNLSTIEHAVVFDNKTVFGDTIYNTSSGLRMGRLIMKGQKTANWKGYVNAHGFILNEADVEEWSSTVKYPKGQIVTYKNLYWTATTLIEASDTFDYTLWKQTSYDQIKQGLLPNPSTTAYEATQLYDVQQANLDRDQDLLAFGLIGFRKRNYMSDAALTDVSQINVYKNMIKSKGTNLAADAFKDAEPLQGKLGYTLYENWAIKTADFGSVLNSNFVEVALQKDQLTGNPAIIGFGDSMEKTDDFSVVAFQSGVHQRVSVGDTSLRDKKKKYGTKDYVYKNGLINYGRAPDNANFLPTYSLSYVESRGLPTAGYVNINDTTYQAYNLTDLNSNSDNYSKLYRGDIVWVANYYDRNTTSTAVKQGWDIFTPVSVGTTATTATNNLNGTVTITFAGQHGLVKDEPFVIIGFDSKINGYYEVKSVQSIRAIVVNKTLAANDMKLAGTGIVFKLKSVRVEQPSDLAAITEHVKYSEFATHRVWADSDTKGNWAVYKNSPVYKKQASVFGTTTDSSGNIVDTNPGKAGLGTSVAYTKALGTLSVDTAGKLYADGVDTGLTMGTGNLVAMGDYVYGHTTSAVYLATKSGTTWSRTQLTTTVSGTIVSIAVSGDRRWMFVADSSQSITVYLLDGTTSTLAHTLPANAVGSFGKSITTTYDGSKLIVGASDESITVSGTTYKEGGAVYVYSRGSEARIANGSTTQFTIAYAATTTTVAVYINNELQTSGYTVSGTTLTFTTAPADGDAVTIDYGTLTLQQRIVSEKPHIGAWFGHSVTTNKYGAEVFIGAPYELATVNGTKNVEGAVYRFTNAGQRYGVVTATPTAFTGSVTIFIDGHKVVLTSNVLDDIAADITEQEPTNVVATVSGSQIIIKNKDNVPGTPNDLIDIVGLTQADLTKLGIISYVKTQVINDLNLDNNSQFGWTVAANQGGGGYGTDSIAIGSPAVDTYHETTFDFTDDLTVNDTLFDNGATTFVDVFPFTGGVYQYDYLPSNSETVTRPGQYAFGQYCNIPTSISERTVQAAAPKWGTAIAYNDGAIIVGSPGWYASGSGRVASFVNDMKQVSSWHIDKQPLAAVDAGHLRSISIYDTETNTTLDNLDYIDPAQGKMLSAVETNIDYISATDPATYSGGLVWGSHQEGYVWLDTTNLRMMNYNQPDIVYNSAYFGRAFPGSFVDIYTWVMSDVPPLNYIGSGFPTSYDNYTSSTVIDKASDTLKTRYFFWVKNYGLVPRGKKLSPLTLVQYILNPIDSGVAFLAALTTNTVALYNSNDNIRENKSALHLGYSTGDNDDVGHQDWTLIQDGNDQDFLVGVPATIDGQAGGMYLKYITSFMGSDLAGYPVPDPSLPELVKYGTAFRPRQSMFAERELALKNFIQYANSISALYPVTENNGTYLLNQQYYYQAEVTTASTTRITVSYNGGAVTGLYAGCPVLFDTIAYGGLEPNTTYYIVETGTVTGVQWITVSATPGGTAITLNDNVGTMSARLYDTPAYWSYSDWWATGYNNNTKVTLEVDTYSDLLTVGVGQITAGSTGNFLLSDGLVARVAKNGNGVNEYYVYNTATKWTRIGLQNGTIKIDSTLYTTTPAPSKEIYYIVRWINEQLYVNELLIEKNRSLIMMFNFIQSQSLQQQNYLPWLNKTSLVDIEHTVRQLYPYKKYQRDSKELVNGYINEVKPFHVYIKDFSFTYDGTDYYEGSFTDFDLPAVYDTAYSKFVSPQMVYDSATEGQYLPTDNKWSEIGYSDWAKNYGLTISNSQVSTVLVTKLTGMADSLTTPKLAMTNTSISFRVDDVTTLPVRGVLQIVSKNGSELIKYTSIDRATNTINGLIRGYKSTKSIAFDESTPVYLVPDAAMVVDSGRGYTVVPRITAHYDTNTYPYGVRSEATFTGSLISEGLVEVKLVTPGSGYPILPDIRVDASSIKDTFLADQVDTVLNQIVIAKHPFVDGDCVTIRDIEDDSRNKELKNYNYYYVKSLSSDIVALYRSYKDAVNPDTAFTTTEVSYAYTVNSSATSKYLSLALTSFIDTVPFNTGDRIRLVYAATPGHSDYYYVQNLGTDTTKPTFVSYGVAVTQDIVLHPTLEEALAGDEDTRFTPPREGTISAVPRTDDRRVTLYDAVAGTLAVTARVKIYTDNIPTRQMKVSMKFDRLTYGTKTKSWQAENGIFGQDGWDTTVWSKGTSYYKGQLVVNNGVLYRANKDITSTGIQGYYVITGTTTVVPATYTGSKTFIRTSELGDADTFNLAFWDEVSADDPGITAADRIAGFYKPTVDMPSFTLDNMSTLMTGVTNPNQTVTDYSFGATTTYAFLAGQVDLSNNTIELRRTQSEVASYREHIIGSTDQIITLQSVPVVIATDDTKLTVKETMNLHVNDRVRFTGIATLGNISTSTNYLVKSVDSATNTITVGDSAATATFTANTGYMTILPVEYNTTGTSMNRDATSNIAIGGDITINTTDYVTVNDTVRFSNSIITATATRTYASSNPSVPSQILLTSTENLAPGMMIQFTGTEFGNIGNIANTTSNTYYIKEVISSTNITITDTLNGLGPVRSLTSGTGSMTVTATGIIGRYTTTKAIKTTSGSSIVNVVSTAELAVNMPVIFTGTASRPLFGGLSSNNYTIASIVSATEITLYDVTAGALFVANSTRSGSVVLTGTATGVDIDKNYYVKTVNATNSSITVSDTYGGTEVSLTTTTGLLSIDTTDLYATDVNAAKKITVSNANTVNAGDSIYFTAATGTTSFGGITVTTNTATPTLYTVETVDTTTNLITVVEDTGLVTATGGRLTMWRKDTPAATNLATGDIVKVNYILPSQSITDNLYVEKLTDNTIRLHSTSIGASTPLTTDIVTLPYNATGTVSKPQAIVILKDTINYIDPATGELFYPVGTVFKMLFEQSFQPSNFGLTNNREYYVRIMGLSTVAIYNTRDDAENNIEDRIPLVSQHGGQFILGSNYDNIIAAPDLESTAETAVDITGAPFQYGYGPEELVAGIVTDGINFTVTTRPGATWDPLAPIHTVKATDIVVGVRYRIVSLGNTDWNIIADTTLSPLNYTVGDEFTAAVAGTGTGTVTTRLYGNTGFNVGRLSNITVIPFTTKLANGTDYSTLAGASTYKGYISFRDTVMSPAYVVVYVNNRNDIAGQTRLTPNLSSLTAEYDVDWINQVVLIKNGDAGRTYDVVVYEYGNGSLLLRSNTERYPFRKVLNPGSTTEYHSEIYLDVPYYEVELPSASNYWLSTQVVIGGELSDTVRLTNLRDTTSPEYGDVNPTSSGFIGHYTIQAQRPLDPVNDLYNPAKIVFTELYDETHYAAFALTTNVIGMFVATTDGGVLKTSYQVPITAVNYYANKLTVTVNEVQKAELIDYTLSSVVNGMLTITFVAGALIENDNIKVTYDNNGISIPTAQWLSASNPGAYTGNESVNTILGNVVITGGKLVFTSTQVKTDLTKIKLIISGTLTGTATISGYTGTTTTYTVASTNGNTEITLSGVTLTDGTTTGLTFTLVTEKTVSRQTYPINGFLGDNNYSAITPISIEADGTFKVTSTVGFKVNDAVIVTGAITGTATIAGYSAPKTYYIASTTDGYTNFKLSTYFGGPADLITTPGTLLDSSGTNDLTFSVENNLVVEIDGMRYDGASDAQTYRKIINVDLTGGERLSYPAPVYSPNDFDDTYFVIQVNGSDIPRVDPTSGAINWGVNYDVANQQFYQFDADLGGFGIFDNGTPFDNQSVFNVVFNPAQVTLEQNDIITVSYQVPGEVPPDTFLITANENKIGGEIHILSGEIDTVTAKLAFTTFNRTKDQSLITQRVSDLTVSTITKFSNLSSGPGSVYPGITVDGLNPPMITVYDWSSDSSGKPHNIVPKYPLQQVIVHGTGIEAFDDKVFYASTINYRTDTTAAHPLYQVYLYTTDKPTSASTGWDTATTTANFTSSAGFLQVIDARAEYNLPKSPLQIKQPRGYTITDVNRLYVSIVPKDTPTNRQYISPSNLKLIQYNDVSTLVISKAISAGDQVLVTSMVPQATPGERKFRINSTWNTVSGVPNSPVIYRENEFTRAYITDTTYVDGELYSITVSKPYDLVTTATFTGKTVQYNLETSEYYITVDGILNTQVVNLRVYENNTTNAIAHSWVPVSNLTTVKIVFATDPGVTIDVSISSGNQLLVNGEILRYSDIDLTYTSSSYGVITGLTRGINATGAATISKYDAVQSILFENQVLAKYNQVNWYDNIVKAKVTSYSSAGSVGVYTLNYTGTTDTLGLTTYPVIDIISANNMVAFGNAASTLAAASTAIFATETLEISPALESTNGIYVFDISSLNTSSVTGNYLTRANDDSTYIVGLEKGDEFTMAYANTTAITHSGSKTTFTITSSYVNTANSSQWIIEAQQADDTVPTTAVLSFANNHSNNMLVKSSYKGASANTWVLEVTGGPAATANITTVSVVYNANLPLQLNTGTVAGFLNQQFR